MKPIIPIERTDEDRKINRRVEFTIVPEVQNGDKVEVNK